MSQTRRRNRRKHDLRALHFVQQNLDVVIDQAIHVYDEVEVGQRSLPKWMQEARLTLALAERLDNMFPAPPGVEAWDRLLWLIVAAVGLVAWRRWSKTADRGASDPMKLTRNWIGRLVAQAEERVAEAA